ncbi:hypothetical protein [Chamaesiphon sp. VAR_48_metabat_403]|uniref:hypothetical protein n=1 Tax=Chamaesiphon sp. VAR_48_metabat_403 TaxID=2964700 RepID=UPI00286E12F1|nr:hypothetical protein [Chamaesiphon sp. VAR_48_metabat_403]
MGWGGAGGVDWAIDAGRGFVGIATTLAVVVTIVALINARNKVIFLKLSERWWRFIVGKLYVRVNLRSIDAI